MKKLISLILVTFMLFAICVSMSSCAHKPFDSWSHDDDGHWHACARFSGCDKGCKFDETAHVFGEWKRLSGTQHFKTCSVCGYDDLIEKCDFSSEITKVATPDADGEITYTCDDCGASYVEDYEYED